MISPVNKLPFRFIIVSVHSGDVTGTDNEKIAKNVALSEEDFVIDVQTGLWIDANFGDSEIPETHFTEPDAED